MAKKKTGMILVKMESTAGTGHSYVVKKNTRNHTEKWTMNKYDPRARKHVEYKETKMPPHSANK